MSDVKRYDLKLDGDYSDTEGVMTETSNGDWVRADDYDAVKEDNDRLRSLISSAFASTKDAFSHLSEA